MRPVNPQNMRAFTRLGARSLVYTAVSDAIRKTGRPGGGDWRVVYNCARPEKYQLATDVDARTAPLLFLARLERCKGAHTAIDVARAAKRPLIIAGNVSQVPHEREYFERELQPLLDGPFVQYVGPVDDAQKIKLLRESAALLTPIEWDEPFPVTLPEAMLCGTPLVTFRRGGTPEGIDHGVTGFVCDTVADMVAAVDRLHTIDRAALSGRSGAALLRWRDHVGLRVAVPGVARVSVSHGNGGMPAGDFLNVGSGPVVRPGWISIDGSWQARLAGHPLLAGVAQTRHGAPGGSLAARDSVPRRAGGHRETHGNGGGHLQLALHRTPPPRRGAPLPARLQDNAHARRHLPHRHTGPSSAGRPIPAGERGGGVGG